MQDADEVPVTVIVCCYNAAATIGETLESLLAQSHRALEVLVIDDGSTDGSAAVAEGFAARDPRVRLLRNEGNRGTAFTRMRGLSEARTDLVMFFDADDLADPDLVAAFLARIREDTALLGVSCYARYFSEAGDLGIQRVGPVTREECFDIFSRGKLVFLTPVTLFRRAEALAVGGYRQSILPNAEGIRYEDFSEDLDLWCRMSDLGAEGRYFVTIPRPLFRYRKPAGSLSTRNVQLMQLKMRWIKDCLTRRRAGRPELSLADFIASRSWLDRWNDRRADLAAGFYKRAGFAWSAGSYPRMAAFVLLTGLLSPKLIRQKVRMQTTRRSA